jgi:hypothetical protein
MFHIICFLEQDFGVKLLTMPINMFSIYYVQQVQSTFHITRSQPCLKYTHDITLFAEACDLSLSCDTWEMGHPLIALQYFGCHILYFPAVTINTVPFTESSFSHIHPIRSHPYFFGSRKFHFQREHPPNHIS